MLLKIKAANQQEFYNKIMNKNCKTIYKSRFFVKINKNKEIKEIKELKDIIKTQKRIINKLNN